MNDNRIKVLQVVGNARIGGVAAFILNYYKRVDLERFCFDFVTYAPSSFDEEVTKVDPNAKVYYISPFQRNFIKGIAQLEKICKKGGYDIVHSHLTTLSAFSLSAAHSAGIPVRICHAHSAFNKNSEHYLIKSFLRPFAADNATHLMACSAHAAQSIFGKRAGVATILPNAIDLDRFLSSQSEYEEARNRLGVTGRAVLFVGRFEYQKNIPLLLRAFARAAAEDKELNLLIIGDGTRKKEIEEIIAARGIGGRVRIVEPCDPAPYYKAADLFCLPSRYEGLGIVAIEAQTSGLHCLLSEAVPKEADVTGRCTFLPDDIELWAEELKKPRGHFYDCRKALADAHYDITLEAERLTKFYESALRESQ